MSDATGPAGPRSWLVRRGRLRAAAQDARLAAVEERVDTLLDVVHEACQQAGVPVSSLISSRPELRIVRSEASQPPR